MGRLRFQDQSCVSLVFHWILRFHHESFTCRCWVLCLRIGVKLKSCAQKSSVLIYFRLSCLALSDQVRWSLVLTMILYHGAHWYDHRWTRWKLKYVWSVRLSQVIRLMHAHFQLISLTGFKQGYGLFKLFLLQWDLRDLSLHHLLKRSDKSSLVFRNWTIAIILNNS